MKLDLGSSWAKKLEKRVQGFEFEVGVLDDAPHRDPLPDVNGQPQLSSYAGGPVRKAGRISAEGKSIGEVLIENMTRLNINILLRPFQEKNSDILKFTDAFLKLVVQRPGISIRRVENLLQAIVRNPILKQEYGNNKSHTADAKGFDRHLIDTAQVFKSIKARVKRRV